MLKTTTPKFIFSISILLASISTTTMKLFDDPLMLLKLENIKESELQNIIKMLDEKTETYSVTLPNKDELIAVYFHSGPSKGTIYCARTKLDSDSNTIDYPISSEYFHLLKDLAETKQLTTQEKKDL